MSTNSNVSFFSDEFLCDKTVWIAILSDGLSVYQDDARPGRDPSSAWVRLTSYLKQNPDLKITKLGVKFRSHTEWLPENMSGYYFSNGILRGMQSTESQEYKVLGYVEDDRIVCRWYSVPELIVINTTTKELTSSVNLISSM